MFISVSNKSINLISHTKISYVTLNNKSLKHLAKKFSKEIEIPININLDKLGLIHLKKFYN